MTDGRQNDVAGDEDLVVDDAQVDPSPAAMAEDPHSESEPGAPEAGVVEADQVEGATGASTASPDDVVPPATSAADSVQATEPEAAAETGIGPEPESGVAVAEPEPEAESESGAGVEVAEPEAEPEFGAPEPEAGPVVAGPDVAEPDVAAPEPASEAAVAEPEVEPAPEVSEPDVTPEVSEPEPESPRPEPATAAEVPAAAATEPAPATGSDDPDDSWSPRPWEAPTIVMPPVAPVSTPAPQSTAPPTPTAPPIRVSPFARPETAPADGTGPTPPDAPAAPAADSAVPPPDTTRTTTGGRRPEPGPAAGETSPMDVFPDEHRRRRWPRVVGLLAAVVVVLGGLYVGALWLWSDRVPPGATVAGVEIGTLESAEAVTLLGDSLEAASTEPIAVAAGDKRTELDPITAGLTLDPQATVDQVTGFGLEPIRLWHQLFGTGVVPPVSEIDTEALEAAVVGIAESLATAPIDGTVVFVDGRAQGTQAVDGAAVDPVVAVERIAAGWLTAPRPIELPTTVTPPAITQDEVERTIDEVARPLAGAPIGVAVADQVAELPADVVAGAASFVPEDGALVLRLDGESLVEAVTARTTNLLTSPSDASFAFENGAPVIVPGIPGTTLDPDALAAAVADAATGSDRTARVDLVETDPAESTAELEALGITQIVSEFSTPLNSEPRRTSNLVNGASKINGVLIRPDETFSLTEALGPIDAAHGFVQAGAIVSGEHVDAWGGGLSQLSTTTYNAAYLAGFEDVEHHPHSEWFSRYPEGREATIFTGVIDLQWKNNTPYGALVQSWVEGGRVHVRIWGTPYWTVESTTSGRSGVVAPTTVYSQSPTCVPQSAGNPGFTVTVTRRVLLDGVEQDTTSWTVRYRPQNKVICGPAPEPTG